MKNNVRASERGSVRAWGLLLLMLLAGQVYGAEIVTATITITNAPLTNGQTITVNGSTRTWTNHVMVPATQILTNSTIGGATTNLYFQVGANRFSGLSLYPLSATNSIVLQSAPGGALTVVLSAGWGSVLLQTNSFDSGTAVVVPYTVAGAPQQTNITSGVAAILDAPQSTNQVHENAPAMVNFLGNTNAQTIAGIKQFTNQAGVWAGIVSNSPGIGGNVYFLSNGVWWSGKLANPTLTNGINYGLAFRSPGSATDSEQFGTGAAATGVRSFASGKGAAATGQDSTAVGANAYAGGTSSGAFGASAAASNAFDFAFGPVSQASGSNSAAIGPATYATHPNSTVIGYGASSSRSGQVLLGNSIFSPDITLDGNLTVTGVASNLTASGTWNFPQSSDLAFARFSVTSLANGANADVDIGTNVLIEVSGPTSAFSIAGFFTHGVTRDGKIILVVNRTGFPMTILNESGLETANRRILTVTGLSRSTQAAGGTARFFYHSGVSRWIVSGLDNEQIDLSSVSLPDAGTAGTYRSVTTDSKGRVVSGSNPTSFAAYLISDTSANLAAALTDETGSGAAVFGTSPTIVTPTIASFANANHNHQNSAGGGTLDTSALGSGTVADARLPDTGTAGTYTKITFDAKGRETSGTTLAAGDIPTLTLAKISDAGTAAYSNATAFSLSGAVTNLDSRQIIQTNHVIHWPTNAITAGVMQYGLVYLTNITAAWSPGAFSGASNGMFQTIHLWATNNSGSDRVITYPSGVVGADGERSSTVTNNQAKMIIFFGVGNLFTNAVARSFY